MPQPVPRSDLSFLQINGAAATDPHHISLSATPDLTVIYKDVSGTATASLHEPGQLPLASAPFPSGPDTYKVTWDGLTAGVDYFVRLEPAADSDALPRDNGIVVHPGAIPVPAGAAAAAAKDPEPGFMIRILFPQPAEAVVSRTFVAFGVSSVP